MKLLLLLLVIGNVLSDDNDDEEEVKFTIFHSNDFHGKFEQVSATNGRCAERLETQKKCYGGFARTAHM